MHCCLARHVPAYWRHGPPCIVALQARQLLGPGLPQVNEEIMKAARAGACFASLRLSAAA